VTWNVTDFDVTSDIPFMDSCALYVPAAAGVEAVASHSLALDVVSHVMVCISLSLSDISNDRELAGHSFELHMVWSPEVIVRMRELSEASTKQETLPTC
jgi:hypothetical protein